MREGQFANQEAEKYRGIRQDGLDDVFQGIALALMAPFFLDRGYWWIFLLGIVIRSCYTGRDILRRRFTLPRLGHASFALPKERRNRVIMSIAALPMLLLGGLLMWVVDPQRLAGSGLSWILPLYCAAALTAAALLRAVRYGDLFDYIHTALFLEGGFVGLFLILFGLEAGKATALQLWGLAVILAAIGLVRLILFCRQQTGPAREVSHGEG